VHVGEQGTPLQRVVDHLSLHPHVISVRASPAVAGRAAAQQSVPGD